MAIIHSCAGSPVCRCPVPTVPMSEAVTERRYKTAWDLADAHVTEMLHLLDVIGQRGIRIDQERLSEFNLKLDGLMAELQAKLDADPELRPLRGWHPKEGYVRPPSIKCAGCDGKGKVVVLGGSKLVCPDCGGAKRFENTDGLELATFMVNWRKAGVEFEPSSPDVSIQRWAKRKPFLATSSKQVLAYQRSRGHKIATTAEGDETSGQKALLLAWRKYKDDHYRDFVEFRKLKKLRGTYGEWPFQSRIIDGRQEWYITTKFTLRPDNGRLSSLRPNVQNIPRDGPLARMFKECLVASPGSKLVRGDWTSAEALITGYLAGDLEYMRLCRGGIHKFTLAQYLKLPVSEEMPDEVIDLITKGLKEAHSELYRKVKTARFGSTYLAGARKIFEENPLDFESTAEARKFQALCARPKITAWQQRTMTQAQMSKKLVNPFGYEKQFWDLPGGDGPSAVAFLPSSIVAWIARECMLQLWRMEAGRYLVWQIHDELVADVPLDRVDAVRSQMKTVMEQPWPELGGLSIGVDMKVSDSMA